MRMTHKLQIVLSLSIALMYSPGGFTQQTTATTEASEQKPRKFYDVEIIIFKNKSVPKGSELNLPTPSPSKTDLTVDLSNPNNDKKNTELGFINIQQQELRLLDTVQQIVKSSRYDLLIHTGWRQPGLARTENVAVWIKGGQIFGEGYSSIDQAGPVVIDQPTDQQGSTETLVPAVADGVNELKPKAISYGLYELEGEITITLSRYLHTQANLVLRKPVTERNVMEANDNQLQEMVDMTLDGRLFNYGLKEQRRMRSKRLHYLDSPQLGLLVLITPYEAPPEEEAILMDETVPSAVEGTPIAVEPPAQ